MNNQTILIGVLVDLLLDHEDYLMANIRVYRPDHKKYDLIPVQFSSMIKDYAMIALLEGYTIIVRGELRNDKNNLYVVAERFISVGESYE